MGRTIPAHSICGKALPGALASLLMPKFGKADNSDYDLADVHGSI